MGDENVGWALKTLYGDEAKLYDMTSIGYQRALKELRVRSPSLARRVERILDPVLQKEKLFPRRGLSWRESSEGRKVRLALLPRNPHLGGDVRTIRKVLGIPEGHVSFSKEDPLVLELEQTLGVEAATEVVQENVAVRWLIVHETLGRPLPLDPGELLPSDMRRSAESASRVRMGSVGPGWLRRLPEPPGAARLTERYSLPWWVVQRLKFYVITQNPTYITGLEPYQVNVSFEGLPTKTPGVPRVSFGDPASTASGMRITIRGIDEFTSQQDWLGIWQRYIRPEQDRLWSLRATRPEGRRRDVRRLEEGLSIYIRMLEEGLSVGELVSRSAPFWVPEEVEPETLRRLIQDLASVLAPKG